MKKFFTLVTLLFLVSLSAGASNEPVEPPSRFALGLSGGWVVGNGLLLRSYRNDYYWQGTFVGSYDRDSKESYLDGSLSYAGYLTPPRPTLLGTDMALKWLAGAEVEYEDYPDSKNHLMHYGAGVGVDIGSARHPGLVISLDYFYTLTLAGYKRPELKQLLFRPAFTLLFNF